MSTCSILILTPPSPTCNDSTTDSPPPLQIALLAALKKGLTTEARRTLEVCDKVEGMVGEAMEGEGWRVVGYKVGSRELMEGVEDVDDEEEEDTEVRGRERESLREKLRRAEEENSLLRAANEEMGMANDSYATRNEDLREKIKLLSGQQKKLYDGFKLLREKYDSLKADNGVTMWEYIPQKIPGYDTIHPSNTSIFETSSRVGQYSIHEILGEGQFADVRVATVKGNGVPLAVKIMKKEKVHTVLSLKRVQNEIAVLGQVRHRNIIMLRDVIFTAKHVYLFVEMGGPDLFEFFDNHLDGVDAKVAREIIRGISDPVAYLHERGICHRDLKPENVLLKVGPDGVVHSRSIQICDFGLCKQGLSLGTKTLSEFCGSPGFFAPEMVIGGGRYNGLAVDVWSIGCIMLELTLGHDTFCSDWMRSYVFDVIKRPSYFADSIEESVRELQLDKVMNEQMQSFVRGCLVVEPDDRWKARDLIESEWLESRPLSAESEDEDEAERGRADSKHTDSEPNSPFYFPNDERRDSVDEGNRLGSHSHTHCMMAEAKTELDGWAAGRRHGNMSVANSDQDLERLERVRVLSMERTNSGENSGTNSPTSDAINKVKEIKIGGSGGGNRAEAKKGPTCSNSGEDSGRARRHFNGDVQESASPRGGGICDKKKRMRGLGSMAVDTGRGGSGSTGGAPDISFPPIEPRTPSLNSAKQTLQGTGNISPSGGRRESSGLTPPRNRGGHSRRDK